MADIINIYKYFQRLEETFAQQLEEQEQVYGPMSPPLTLPNDLTEFHSNTVTMSSSATITDGSNSTHIGSTRSSLSSVSEG